jgi:putative aldouronate transport system substrate-binding protein
MKKIVSFLLVFMIICSLFTACSDDSEKDENSGNSEIIDGKFTETKTITVEIFDRGNDGGSTPDDNYYTDYIKEGMLKNHNVEVEFVKVPRWTEVEQMNNLLASGKAPDICVTYDFPTIQTYANMGGVLDLNELLEDNKDLLTNMWELLGDDNIYWDQNVDTKELYAIEAMLFQNKRVNTFVREDWLEKLNLSEPTNIDEFEDMLKAFKDNADMLLGDEAENIIPFTLSYDIGWRADTLFNSFVPSDYTDEEMYVNGFDDRRMLWEGFKEGSQKLNEWYNDGLIWKDFALYKSGDKTEDNLIKAGYVGAFIHNWDYPYRDAENGITANLKKSAGDDAEFIAVDTFKNDAGEYKKYLSAPVDRKIFFPTTNDEPVASLLYLDWISKLENRKFLQIGEEGVTHEKLDDGSVKTIAAEGEKIMNSPNNIDYTITINGLDLGDEETTLNSIANGYAGVEPRLIEKAYEIASNDTYISKRTAVGEIKAEEGQGASLAEKRDTILPNAIVAKENKFDSVFDSGLEDYLKSGGQAIIDERQEAYNKYYK